MTHRLNDLSRRNMFTIAAGGASALAVGRMLGGTAFAAAPKVKPLTEAQLPKGLLTVPGDLTLDPTTEAFARKVLARMKQSVLDAATRPGELAKDDKVAAASSKLVASLRTSRLTRVKAAFKPGSKYKEVAEMTKVQPKQAHEMYAVELKELMKRKKEPTLKVPKEEKPQWQGPLARKIEFQLNSVKCVDTTDGWGSDEILMGGTIITPGGVVKKIAAWKVGDGFDNGDARFYDFSKCKGFPANMPKHLVDAACPRGNPNDVYEGRKLESTRLNIDIPWPATIALVLTMGEQDSGGFNQLVQEGYAAIEAEVKKKLVELGMKAGEAIYGELGAAIGAALAVVVGEFLDWLVSLFNDEDDFINSKSWVVQLNTPEMNAIRQISSSDLTPPAGVLASSMKKLTFIGNGGKYETRLHWRVST